MFRLLGAMSPALSARLALRLFTMPRAREVSAQDDAFLAGAISRRLASASGDLQLYEWPAAGPAVLVVHGWISHAARMREVIEALRARSLRVIAFDAPAHGRSTASRLDLLGYRDALSRVSRACAPIAAVLAHSFGAITTISWLAEQSEGVHLQAAVLIGLPRDVGFLFDSFTLAMGLAPGVIRRMRELFRARYGCDPQELCAAQLARRIGIPVLLVHGGADEFVPPAHSSEVAAALPDARLLVLSGLNHSEPLRDAVTVALMSDFIADRVLPDRAPLQ
jgi:pimeloyl-ACP methyl ester carboxylesterase